MTIVRPSDDPIESVRRDADDALAAILPEPEAGLAAGVMIGLRDRVDRDVAADLTTAGLSHIVAISGWNIAVVAGLIAALLRGWPRRRRSVAMIVRHRRLHRACGRVAERGTSCTHGRRRARPRASAAARARRGARWAWPPLAMLLAEPATVLDAGFLLSVAATAGLLAWATPLTDGIGGPIAVLDAGLDRGGARRLARGPGRDAAHRARRLRPALARGAAREPRCGAARAAGDGRRRRRRAGRLARRGRAAGRHRRARSRWPPGRTFGALIAIGRVAARVPLASLELPPIVAILLAAVTVVGLAIVAVGRSRLRSSAARGLPALGRVAADRASPMPQPVAGPSGRPATSRGQRRGSDDPRDRPDRATTLAGGAGRGRRRRRAGGELAPRRSTARDGPRCRPGRCHPRRG